MVLPEQVPDSEDECGEITTSMISSRKVARLLDQMALEDRMAVGARLKQKYRSLLTDREWEDPGLALRRYDSLRPAVNAEQDVHPAMDVFSDSDLIPTDHLAPLRRSSDTVNVYSSSVANSQSQVPAIEGSSSNTANSVTHSIHEDHTLRDDESNLKIYLDSRNYETTASRRGLRKRNFASTHPYLADQAHYLGLTRVEYLNEIFEERRNVEDIIRFLNQSYVSLKKSSPRDEKFRANNFYSILGKQSTAAKQKEKEEEENDTQNKVYQDEEEPSITQEPVNISHPYAPDHDQLDWDLPNLSDSEDESTMNSPFARHHHSRILNIDGDESDDTSQDEDHQNHRSDNSPQRKRTKSVYKYVLPESTKHFDINELHVKKRDKPKQIKYGRGVAIKKKRSSAPSGMQEDLQLIDDDVDQDDHQAYLRFDNSLLQNSLEKYRQLEDPIIEVSDNSPTDTEDEAINEDVHDTWFADEPIQENALGLSRDLSDNEHHRDLVDPLAYYSDDSVQEYDAIDTMYSRPSSVRKKSTKMNRSSLSKRSSPSSTATKSSTLGLHRNSPSSRAPITRSPITRSPITSGTKRKRSTTINSRAGYSGPQRVKSYNTTSTKRQSTFSNSKVSALTKKPLIRQRKSKAKQKAEVLAGIPLQREPVQHTIPFEAESATRMVKPLRFTIPQRRLNLDNLIPNSSSDSFPKDFILSSISVQKIHDMQHGKTYATHEDSVNIDFAGELYTLTLVDLPTSSKACEKILVNLVRRLKDPQQLIRSPLLVSQIYQCLKGLLRWLLIVQGQVSSKTWKCVKLAITLLTKNPNDTQISKKYMFLYPYFCLLWFTLSVISKVQNDKFKPETNLYSFYWRFYFQHFDLDIHGSMTIVQERSFQSLEFESFYLMCSILNVQGRWWSSISTSLAKACTEVDIETVMAGLSSLAFETETHSIDWTPFYTLYGQIGAKEDSKIYISFLDLVSMLHTRLGWPLEETLILKLYRTITSRKFANFEDEHVEPRVLGKIRSRNEIPEDSFFDGFMYLFYCYVSDLPTNLNKKRLITKLITSSHYIYGADKVHRVMFVNRLNFLQLLSQISEVDLKNQFHDLMSSVASSGDERILSFSIEALGLYFDIVIERHLALPVLSFSVLANNMIKESSNTKLMLKNIFKIIRDIFTKPEIAIEYLIQCLEIYTKLDVIVQDNLSYEVHNIFLTCIDLALQKKGSMTIEDGFVEILDRFTDSVLKALNSNMGRFPLPSVSQEKSVEGLVETMLKLWVRASSLSPNFRGDRLTLQTFPYIGNSQSRDKFSLLYYTEVLSLSSIPDCKDIYTIALLKSLASYAPSKYLPQLMNQLNRNKSEVVLFHAKYIPEEVSSFHLQNFRSRLVLNVLTNIASTTKVQSITKSIYLEEFLKVINSEFDRYFSSTGYKEFCIRSIKSVQKICGEYIQKNGILDSCASKLGISKSELSSYQWAMTPLKGKLSIVHKELIQAIHFNRDVSKVLDRYVLGREVELIYHLVSIYAEASKVNHNSTWKFIYLLLQYFSVNLKMFKFHILSNEFAHFLRYLVSMSTSERPPSAKNDRYYYFKNCFVVAEILSYLRVLFDGYNDCKLAEQLIERFVKDPSIHQQNETKEIFSNFRLGDIQDSSSDYNSATSAEPSHDEIAAAKTAFVTLIEEDLKRSEVDVAEESCVLDYDFTF